MHITAYTAEQRHAWDAFVSINRLASHGHLSSNFALLGSKCTAVNRSLMIYADNGDLLGVLPLFERRDYSLRLIPEKRLVSGIEFPAGPLFKAGLSTKTETSCMDLLMSHIDQLARQVGASEVTITYPSIIGEQTSLERLRYLPLRDYGYTERSKVYFLLDLRRNEKDLFAGLNRLCHRELAAAKKAGAIVKEIQSPDDWFACHDLNQQTLAAAEAVLSHQAMEVVWEEFIAKQYATAVITEVNGVIMACVVLVHFKGAGYNWLAFNRKPHTVPGTHRLALWEAILASRRKGIMLLDSGSKSFSGTKLRAISAFIESFGGTPTYSICGTKEIAAIKTRVLALAEALFSTLRARTAHADLSTTAPTSFECVRTAVNRPGQIGVESENTAEHVR